MGKVVHQSVNKIWNLKGPQKLKFYCQMCQKQCRDQHGFEAHCSSGGHMDQMMLFAANKDHYLAAHSKEFQTEFMNLLKSRFKEPTELNFVYQEYIKDSEHMHLNATKWSTLTSFAQHLGKEGLVRVQERENGLYISPIDQSNGNTLERLAKQERPKLSDEQRERLKLQRIIEKAHKEKQEHVKVDGQKEPEPLQLEKSGKIAIKMKPIVQKKTLQKNRLLK